MLGNELLNLRLVLLNPVIIRGQKKVVQLLLSMCCVHGDVGKTKKKPNKDIVPGLYWFTVVALLCEET